MLHTVGAGRVTYRPNNSMGDGLGGYMNRSTALRAALTRIGNKVQGSARAKAIGLGLVDTGEYVSSFYVTKGDTVVVKDGPFVNPRMSVEVGNSARHAAALEFGSKTTNASHVLLSAAMKHGSVS